MAWYEILMVSIGLSLDVFTYALYKGAMISRIEGSKITRMVLLFAGWQSGAMLLGSLASNIPYIATNYERTANVFRALSAVIFFGIGIWMMVKAVRMKEPEEHRQDGFAWKQMCIWAMLTSLDSVFTGIGMGFLNTAVTVLILQLAAATVVAVIAGIYVGYRVGCHWRNRALAGGAMIFLMAGIDVIFRYYGG